MKASVYCTTKTIGQAESIVDELKLAGFTNNDISALLPDKRGTKDFAHEHNTKAPEGATAGGVAGLGVGAALGWLAGIGSLAIPGVGPFIAAGPIMAALGGAAVGTAAGGVIGALVGMGIPEFEAKRYDEKIKTGNILISVHTEDSKQLDIAKDIFKRNHADDISTGSEAKAPAAAA
ncbi:hypothetical protein ELE36_15480 [Pseudolysobacter antarcticus]|uniref:DUF3341 domain-containing protein n=1 Tax=Pseudolysobacter antarcticus TaxID=2511995 RepID=A0A411HMI3_9GAMM|nr:hypothetical protein [Pseudolysobacter antarcticus]QBB71647.1 hypothetical protein ELE36_15480 [Pseudolysobacter antarcticus]